MWISSLVYWISYFTSIIRHLPYQYLLKSRQIKTCPLSLIQQLHCPVEYIGYHVTIKFKYPTNPRLPRRFSLSSSRNFPPPQWDCNTPGAQQWTAEDTQGRTIIFFWRGGSGQIFGAPPGGALIFSSQTQDLVSRRYLLHSLFLRVPLNEFFQQFWMGRIIFGKLPSPSSLKKMVKPQRGRVSCGLILEVCFRFNSFLLCWKHATTSSRLEKPRGLRWAEIPTETKSWLTF